MIDYSKPRAKFIKQNIVILVKTANELQCSHPNFFNKVQDDSATVMHYSWPWKNAGVWGIDLPHSQKSVCNF